MPEVDTQMSSFFRRRNNKGKLDDTMFLRNGAILLEKLITSSIGKQNPIRSFSAEDLRLATNDYGTEKIIKHEPFYRLYKGFLIKRNGPVIIMKYHDDRERCFNNIVFSSQINHKNVLKLIGCCLETESPILVFESLEYGTLADHIFNPRPHFMPLQLKHRLKIAMEVTNAVTYLHIGLPKTIIHRDIKLSHILLGEHYVAKLYDFSLSRSIPEGETHIIETVEGTSGFLAPEFISTGKCNERCDVYSFGLLLLELLAGRRINYRDYFEQETDCTKADSVEEDDSTKAHNVKADDSTQPDSLVDDDCSNADYVEEDDSTISGYAAKDDFRVSDPILDDLKKHIENNTFNEIVDPIIVGEASFPEMQQQLQDFIQLICKCINRSAEDRPTMIDVAKQLRQIYLSVV